jgi:1,4-dihydroxy-2-naphthoyl-CoA hydrolase
MAADLPMPAGFVPVVPVEQSFDAALGLELLDGDPDRGIIRARVLITDELRQQAGILHGGVIAALAESIASRGTWAGVGGERAVMGMSNETNFLRALSDGYVTATATAIHRGSSRWLWRVECVDDDGRLCATTNVNIAVRPLPAQR